MIDGANPSTGRRRIQAPGRTFSRGGTTAVHCDGRRRARRTEGEAIGGRSTGRARSRCRASTGGESSRTVHGLHTLRGLRTQISTSPCLPGSRLATMPDAIERTKTFYFSQTIFFVGDRTCQESDCRIHRGHRRPDHKRPNSTVRPPSSIRKRRTAPSRGIAVKNIASRNRQTLHLTEETRAQCLPFGTVTIEVVPTTSTSDTEVRDPSGGKACSSESSPSPPRAT